MRTWGMVFVAVIVVIGAASVMNATRRELGLVAHYTFV